MSDAPSSQPELRQGALAATPARIAIVVSRFNDFITSHLERSAVDMWYRLGGRAEQLVIHHVPGSFELAVTAKRLAEAGEFDAVVCLGCVIQGETDHYDHVVEQTARGIREVGTQTGVPCIFGVITCQTLEQAINRAGGKLGNQGGKAMMAAVEMANLLKDIPGKKPSDTEARSG